VAMCTACNMSAVQNSCQHAQLMHFNTQHNIMQCSYVCTINLIVPFTMYYQTERKHNLSTVTQANKAGRMIFTAMDLGYYAHEVQKGKDVVVIFDKRVAMSVEKVFLRGRW